MHQFEVGIGLNIFYSSQDMIKDRAELKAMWFRCGQVQQLCCSLPKFVNFSQLKWI